MIRALVVLVVTACATPAPSRLREVPPESLYVAHAGDATLIHVDGASGRPLGPARPAGLAPQQVVVGANGAALVLSRDLARSSGLIYVARATSGWQARPVTFEPGARVALLASDGGAYAVAVYVLPFPTTGDAAGAARPGTTCRLALIDLRTGGVERVHTVCTSRDLPTGLAMEQASSGPIAYLALWSRAAQADAAFTAGARLVKLQAHTGSVLDVVPLDGLPRPVAAGGSLVLAPGPDGAGSRLYGIVALPDSELATWNEQEYGWQFTLSSSWRLLRLATEPLQPEWMLRLDFTPTGLEVAPGGREAYAFEALGEHLRQIDLTTGQTFSLARVPGYSPRGLATTRERLYVASPRDNQVWVFDRQRSLRTQVIRVGHYPVWIGAALAGAGRFPATDGTP